MIDLRGIGYIDTSYCAGEVRHLCQQLVPCFATTTGHISFQEISNYTRPIKHSHQQSTAKQRSMSQLPWVKNPKRYAIYFFYFFLGGGRLCGCGKSFYIVLLSHFFGFFSAALRPTFFFLTILKKCGKKP